MPSLAASPARAVALRLLVLGLVALTARAFLLPSSRCLPTSIRPRSSSSSSALAAAADAPSRPPRPYNGGGGGGGGRPGGNRGPRGAPEVDPDKPPMNDQLLRLVPDQVRVVISNAEAGDEMAGVMPTKEALDKARELGLDLIMISETADPPVVKIIDYGKFKYSQEKKKKEQKKKAKTTEVKEVKMSYKIENHDYGVRMKQMTRFLEDGDRVKVMIQFRGREQQHIDLGHELLGKVGVDLKDIATQEGDIRREGGRLMAMFKPKTNK